MTANHSHGAGTAIADTSLVRIEDIEVARAVERARTRLLLDQPSLAAAVMRIPVVQVHSDRLPMGIGAARGAIVVSQALRLKHDAWIMYAYAHNMLHLLFEHIERCGGRDRAVWDLSIDIATASLLDPLLSPEALNYLDYDPRPSHSTGFRLLVQQLGNLSCEQIYDHLFQQPPASQSKATAGEPKSPAVTNVALLATTMPALPTSARWPSRLVMTCAPSRAGPRTMPGRPANFSPS